MADAFQPTAFQFGAFQWAAQNVGRSGVVRMWLAELTAKLNGMLDEEQPKKEKQPKLEKLTENADGSITVGEQPARKRVKSVRKTSIQVAEEPVNNPPPPSHYKKYEERNLPTPEQTASFIISQFNIQITNELWAEEKVLDILKQAAEEAEEEEMLIEAAIMIML